MPFSTHMKSAVISICMSLPGWPIVCSCSLLPSQVQVPPVKWLLRNSFSSLLPALLLSSSISVYDCMVTSGNQASLTFLTQQLTVNGKLSVGHLEWNLRLTWQAQVKEDHSLGGIVQWINVYWMWLYKVYCDVWEWDGSTSVSWSSILQMRGLPHIFQELLTITA